MSSLEKQIEELRERMAQLELSVWGLETSDERNWDLIRKIDDSLSDRITKLEQKMDAKPTVP